MTDWVIYWQGWAKNATNKRYNSANWFAHEGVYPDVLVPILKGVMVVVVLLFLFLFSGNAPFNLVFYIYIIPLIPQIWHYCICSASLSFSENTKTVFLLLLQLVSSFVKFMLTTQLFFSPPQFSVGPALGMYIVQWTGMDVKLRRTNLARK